MRRCLLTGVLLITIKTVPAVAVAAPGDWAMTVYGARLSSEEGWEDILFDPFGAKFVDAFLVAGALSRQYADLREGALTFEAEGQVVYYFGDQHHWEFNAVPIVARWHRFPWQRRVATSAAFGLGVSYATEVPEVEVELEGESHQWMIYWVAELAAGPVNAPWAISLRLHHRSDAWGLMGDEGGMNAVGLGIRYQFGSRLRSVPIKDASRP